MDGPGMMTPRMPPGPEPYLDALKMLARRELSEAQVRQRLARRGHDPESIDAAVARLKGERAIDDARVAEAIARTETAAKRRGRLRVSRLRGYGRLARGGTHCRAALRTEGALNGGAATCAKGHNATAYATGKPEAIGQSRDR